MANVGRSIPAALHVEQVYPLIVTAHGHGSRQMCRMDKFGFPRTSAEQFKRIEGFRTGDLVVAVVPSGKQAGTHVGRVAIRESGYFNITTKVSTIQGISYRYCHSIHRCDGYGYHFEKEGGGIPPTAEATGILPPEL